MSDKNAFFAKARSLVGPTVVAVVVTALLTVGGAAVLRSVVDRNIDSWLQAARHQSPPDSAALAAAIAIPTDLAMRLTQQTTEVRREAFYHLTVAKGFARYQFAAVSVATLTAVLAGILLVPISWKGWQQANQWFVGFFLAFAAATTFFTASNRIYRQGEAVSQNSALYSAYLALEDELLTFRADTHPRDDTVTFVARVDSIVAVLRTLGVSFDSEAAPTVESILEGIPGASPPQANP